MNKFIGKAFGVAAAISICLTVSTVKAESAPQLPDVMVWSAYDLGSSGYSEASSVGNALQTKFDARVRILPSGTSIGRLLPMKTGKARYGFLSNETFFAAEGIYEFADQSWGPQDVRILLGRPATVGIIVAADTGVKTVAGLKGKRVGYVKGNPSLNIKTDAYLAFGGLTRDDVEVIWFGSYGALKDSMLSNGIDAMGMVPTSSLAREIEASSRGIQWLSFEPENTEGWKAATDIISFAEPVKETSGAGISEEHPVWLIGYRYPMIVTYADSSADEVYNLVKAIDESFDLFKNAAATSANWEVARSILPPADAPWHEGAIRYAKEKGYWTDAAQAWQDKRLARLELVQAAWNEAAGAFDQLSKEKAAAGTDFDAKAEWLTYWEAYRKEHGID